jgi:asparagine synthase (glutamine-hydrolysing)
MCGVPEGLAKRGIYGRKTLKMCGIAGIYNLNGDLVDGATLVKMTDKVVHRGPDACGYLLGNWMTGKHTKYENEIMGDFGQYNMGMGHRRLAIIDLSEQGAQPMSDMEEGIWIVFNGEVYNYIEIKEELRKKGYKFRTTTDTEVILYAYREWGVGCLERFNGMFAFAIWDRDNKRFFCARDRFGVKPFYYHYDGKSFTFASEIKQILTDKRIERKVNDRSIYDYLIEGHVNYDEKTFFEGILALKPGHYIVIEDGKIYTARYWDINPERLYSHDNEDEISENLANLLSDSIKLRLRSDVPVGSCLSGGIDSSTIVYLANRLLKNEHGEGFQQKTFSAVFDGFKWNERKYIECMIDKTGVDGHFTTLTNKQLISDYQKVMWHQDEPFGSSSVVAQYQVMRLARENGIKVLLDGQGSDEIFGGYFSYFKHFYANMIREFQIVNLLHEIRAYKGNYGRYPLDFVRSALSHLASTLKIKFKMDRFDRISHVKKQKLIPGWINEDFGGRFAQRTEEKKNKFGCFLKESLYESLKGNYLPSYLRYEDRNSMGFSIEARLPFLDYRLVEFAFSLPSKILIKDGVTKYVLRKSMRPYLPEMILDRKEKLGFVTPEDGLLREETREWIFSILNSKSFKENNHLNPNRVISMYQDYLNGNLTLGHIIWRCLNLEMWREVVVGA